MGKLLRNVRDHATHTWYGPAYGNENDVPDEVRARMSPNLFEGDETSETTEVVELEPQVAEVGEALPDLPDSAYAQDAESLPVSTPTEKPAKPAPVYASSEGKTPRKRRRSSGS